MVRAHIHFIGTVQGVGFRYTTLSFAQELIADRLGQKSSRWQRAGSCRRPPRKNRRTFIKIKAQFGSFIREQQIEWLGSKGEFDEFSIYMNTSSG